MATFREHCLFPVIEDLTITKHKQRWCNRGGPVDLTAQSTGTGHGMMFQRHAFESLKALSSVTLYPMSS